MHDQMANQYMISELPTNAPLDALRRHISQASANQAIWDDASLDAHMRLLQEVNTLIAAGQTRIKKTKTPLLAQPARDSFSPSLVDTSPPAVTTSAARAHSADKKQLARQSGILQKWSAEIQQLERETSIQIAGLLDQAPDLTAAF